MKNVTFATCDQLPIMNHVGDECTVALTSEPIIDTFPIPDGPLLATAILPFVFLDTEVTVPVMFPISFTVFNHAVGDIDWKVMLGWAYTVRKTKNGLKIRCGEKLNQEQRTFCASVRGLSENDFVPKNRARLLGVTLTDPGHFEFDVSGLSVRSFQADLLS